jgi:hypothetical protein
MYESFGDVGLGQFDPELTYFTDDLGNATLLAALGCQIIWAEDNYPDALFLTEDQIRSLRCPEDVTSLYPMCEIIRQANEIRHRRNQDVNISWNVLGLQNLCVKLRGAEFFADYYGEPELVKQLLDTVMKITLKSVDFFCKRHSQFPSVLLKDKKTEFFVNQNCTVPIAGPKIYKKWLLPRERQLQSVKSSRGLHYAIHHCGKFDDYASLYSQVNDIVWLEIGWESNLRSALNAFPDAWIQYIVSFKFINESTPKEILSFMQKLIDTAGNDLHRLSLNIADIEYGTPDENIRAALESLT